MHRSISGTMLALMSAVLFFTGFPRLTAQSQYARLVGTVTDSTGAVVVKASVAVINTATNLTKYSETDERGDYLVENLPPGHYDITVQAAGFQARKETGIRLEVNGRVRLDFTMRPGVVSESITVAGVSPIVDSETAEIGQVTGERAIRDLPLNGRDVYQLARYTTGAVVAPQSDTPPEQEPLPGFNGQQRTQNLLLTDGADNQDYYQTARPRAPRPTPSRSSRWSPTTTRRNTGGWPAPSSPL